MFSTSKSLCSLTAVLLLLFILPIQASGQTDKLTVYTVNYPLHYFAARIGGEFVEVYFPAPVDDDPAFWQPGAQHISDFQGADLILLNGADYAKWVSKVSLSKRKLVNTSLAFQSTLIHTSSAVTHSHGKGEQHSHDGVAFTTWLDFQQADQQALSITTAFKKKMPEQASFFEERYALLKNDLIALDQELQSISAQLNAQPLVASHPVYQYLARQYKLNIESVMWEPEQYPSELLWAELDTLLKDHSAKWMIWEGEPLAKSIAALEVRGVRSIVFQPVANRPADGDFLSVMKENILALKKAIE